MKNLSEKLPIETWMQIAYYVQDLSFSENSIEEQEKNLQILRKKMHNLNINLEEGDYLPNSKSYVGLLTLLHTIYNIEVIKRRNNKARFYEQICILEELGVQEIAFCPVDFPTKIQDLKQIYFRKNEQTIYKKAYTDGIFEIKSSPRVRKNDNGYLYEIINLRNASYIFNVLLSKKYRYKENKIDLKEASIILKNFNGNFPLKEEILADSFPRLLVPTQEIGFGESPSDFQEKFETFGRKEVNHIRKLKKNL